MAGRQPTGITAGNAIEALQSRAQGRFTTIGRNINKTFVELFYAISCCVQDFDQPHDQNYDQKPLTLINEDADPADPSKKYVPYDPRQTQGIDFRTEVTRQMSLQDAAQLLNQAALLDKNGIPGMGELMLSYADDPSLKYKYKRIVEQFKQEQQASMQQQAQMQADQQRREQVGQITQKVVDAKMQAAQPNPSNQSRNENGTGKQSGK
jgi:hypothetical protein